MQTVEEKQAYNKIYAIKNKAKIAARTKKYREENREKVSAQRKISRVKDREKNKAYDKIYRKLNRKKIIAQQKASREVNHKEYLSKRKAYRKANLKKEKARVATYYQNNKKKIKVQKKVFEKANPEIIKAKNKKYNTERKLKPNFKLNSTMSSSIRCSLKRKNSNGNGKNGYHWEDLVPYSLDNLIKRLKKTLPKGYKWEDYINGKTDLQIDHKIPVSVHNFKSYTDTDFQRCWALKNLQLLPALENIAKGTKLEKPFQPSLLL